MPVTTSGRAMGGAAAAQASQANSQFSYPLLSHKVSIFGDSRAFLCHSGSDNKGAGTGHSYVKGFAYAHHAAAHSMGAAFFPWSLQGGVSGDTTVQALARVPAHITAMQAEKCNLVVIVIGTNDRTGSTIDLETTKQNVVRIVRMFKQAGINVVLTNDTPRGTGSSQYELTNAKQAEHYNYSRWVLTEMAQMCTVINTYDQWLDASSGPLYRPLAQMVRDGIHPSKIGAFMVGRLIGRTLSQMMRTPGDFLRSNAAFDATNNPAGTLTTNPLCTGTTGTLNANCNPAAGSVLATGWGAEGQNMTGLVTNWSKEVDADGTEWQKVRVSGKAAALSNGQAPSFNAFVDITLASLTDQDKVKATGLIKHKGIGLANIGLSKLMTPSWTLKVDSDDSDNTLPWPSDETGPISRETPELVFTTAANHTLIRPRLEITMVAGATVDATIWFTRMGGLKITY